MKITKPFTLDSEIYSMFEKTIPSGERSQVVENLILEFIKIRNPDKNMVKVQREFERKEIEAKLEQLMSLEKQEADKALLEQQKREAELLAREANVKKAHFLDDCRRRAKILVNTEFGFDPLLDILPNGVSDEVREKYRSRHKQLTDELISQGS